MEVAFEESEALEGDVITLIGMAKNLADHKDDKEQIAAMVTKLDATLANGKLIVQNMEAKRAAALNTLK